MLEDAYSPSKRPPLQDLAEAQEKVADSVLKQASAGGAASSDGGLSARIAGLVDDGFLKGRFRCSQSAAMMHVSGKSHTSECGGESRVSFSDMSRILNCARQHVHATATGKTLLSADKWTFFLDYYAEQMESFVGPATVQKRRAGFRQAIETVNTRLAALKDASLGGCVEDFYLGARKDLDVTQKSAVADVFIEILSGSFRYRLRTDERAKVLSPTMGDDEAEALLRLIRAEWAGRPDVLRDAGLPEQEAAPSAKKRRTALDVPKSHMEWLRHRETLLVGDFGPAFLVTCKVLSIAWRDLEGATRKDPK